jgi:hypothetical protein
MNPQVRHSVTSFEAVQGTRDDILAGADRFAPDVMVVDCTMDAGLEVAHVLGLPSAVLPSIRLRT